jgi:drug/metabolite transporter (DMT)-like permease
VVATNYLVLAATLAAYHFLHAAAPTSASALPVGAVMGCCFIVSMLFMTRALELVSVATVLTAFRLAILVPIAASVALWGESVSTVQAGGIAMALGALLLMTRSQAGQGQRAGAFAAMAALLVFSLQGLSQVCLRWVHYAGLSEARLQVLMITAATAGALGAAAVAARRRTPRRGDLAMGAGIGLYNLVALAVMLTTLSRYKGTQFFPVHGCAVVILDNVFAHYYWRERLNRWTAIGAVLGAASMLLVL